MNDLPRDPERTEAATEAAQHVVEEVTSWEYSGERDTTEAALDSGLGEAGVEVGTAERQRLLDEIEQVKRDESRGAPDVRSAEPAGSADEG